jgi:tRNA(Ile)-lysidine synthase
MALASLCSQVQRLPRGLNMECPSDFKILPEYSFQAFIVDHGVRKGSGEEAAAVSKVLDSRGNSL